MTPKTTINVLLVEGGTDPNGSLSSHLTGVGFKVTVVASCLACYVALGKDRYHAVVLDVALPDQSGFVLAEYLRANTGLKIVFVTTHDRVEDRVRGYAVGAHNYFVKPVEKRELQAAIVSLVAGDQPGSFKLAGGAWHLLLRSWELKLREAKAIKLTLLERQFLELLTVQPGEVVMRETLLNAMYHRSDQHSARALDSLVRRLRAKVAAGGHPSPIITAHGVGFCFSGPVIID